MTDATGMTEATGRPRSRGLDALRGLAIALVMAHHALPGLLPGAGVVGVVMFFCLSGYLITGVLAGELARTGTVSLRAFYLRRAARLVPALLLMLAVLSVVTVTLDPLGDRGELGRTLLWALTWTGDLPFGHASDATFHLWTLATEEQFYLVWPALLLLAWRRRRVGAALVLAGVACLLATLATVAWLHADPDLAYALPTSWAGCFVVGAALRLHAGPASTWTLPAWAPSSALVVLLAMGGLTLRGHAATYLVAGPLVAALTGVLILGLRAAPVRPDSALDRLAALGRVSYAAYLWNYPLVLWLPSHAVLATALTLLAAVVSTRYVEEPLLARWGRPGAGALLPRPGAVRP